MQVKLNIGLDSFIGSIDPATAKREVAFVLGAWFNLEVAEFIPAKNENEEDTLFCQLEVLPDHDAPMLAKVVNAIYILSENLHQQCIAAKIDGHGALIGRNAHQWNGGIFDAASWKEGD